MRKLTSVAIAMVILGGFVVNADEGREVAGQKIVESKEVKAQRAKDRKEHEKYLREITRSR